jgi:hypothetical protein
MGLRKYKISTKNDFAVVDGNDPQEVCPFCC